MLSGEEGARACGEDWTGGNEICLLNSWNVFCSCWPVNIHSMFRENMNHRVFFFFLLVSLWFLKYEINLPELNFMKALKGENSETYTCPSC